MTDIDDINKILNAIPETGQRSADCSLARCSAPTCEMEPIFREGKCGKPATHYWLHPDGTKTAVCGRCNLLVWLCGGQLVKVPNARADLPRIDDVARESGREGDNRG